MLQRRNPSSIAAPLGRYTHGVEAPAGARILFVSGQVGIGPDGSLAEGPAGQIERAFLNVKAVLEDNGYSQEDLIKTVTYMTRREDLALLRSEGRPYPEIYAHYDSLRPRFASIYYRTFQTKDSVVAVGCLSDRLRKKMADALDLYDSRFEPGYDITSDDARAFDEELSKKAEALFLQKTTDEWVSLLDGAGVPAGPVSFTEELLQDEQVIANDMVVELEHTTAGKVRMFGPTLRMSETPLEARSASPALGEHTDEILNDLGYSQEDIQGLKDHGVTR